MERLGARGRAEGLKESSILSPEEGEKPLKAVFLKMPKRRRGEVSQAAPLGLCGFPKLVGKTTRILGEIDSGGIVLSCFYSCPRHLSLKCGLYIRGTHMITILHLLNMSLPPPIPAKLLLIHDATAGLRKSCPATYSQTESSVCGFCQD